MKLADSKPVEHPASPMDEDPWRDLLGRLLTVREVRDLLGLESESSVRGLVRRRQLLSVTSASGEERFPQFQFTNVKTVVPAIPLVLEIFNGAVETPNTIAAWLRNPKDYLDGVSPIDWLKHGGDMPTVLAGAEQAAARLAS